MPKLEVSHDIGEGIEVGDHIFFNLFRLEVKPFMVSPGLVEGSNHEWLNRPSFDFA